MNKLLITIFITIVLTLIIGHILKPRSLNNNEGTYLSLQEITIFENKILCENKTQHCFEISLKEGSVIEYSGEIENLDYTPGTRYFITAEITFYNSGSVKYIKSKKIITKTPYPYIIINSQKDNDTLITSNLKNISGTGQFIEETSIKITAITSSNLVIGQGSGSITKTEENKIDWEGDILYTEIHEGQGFLKVSANTTSSPGIKSVEYIVPVIFTSNKAFLIR